MPGLLTALQHSRTFAGRRLRGFLFRLVQLGRGVYIEPGLSLLGAANVALEPGVVIQRRAAIYTRPGSRLTIGAGTRIGTDVCISVAQAVTLGREVLLAPRCFLSDHDHHFADTSVPVMRQGMSTPGAVVIGDGSWLGINVCILRGVVLGRHCVVAANSVVTTSFPDGSVVGGSPARLLRTLPSTANP